MSLTCDICVRYDAPLQALCRIVLTTLVSSTGYCYRYSPAYVQPGYGWKKLFRGSRSVRQATNNDSRWDIRYKRTSHVWLYGD